MEGIVLNTFGGWHAFPKAPIASTLSLAFASDLILKGDSLGLTHPQRQRHTLPLLKTPLSMEEHKWRK